MESTNFIVIYDANVLYPAPLRDLLMNLATSYLFRAKWTEGIHAEWSRNLLEKRPELASKISRTKDLMNQAVPDCLVLGYEDLIDTLQDPNDKHILAAAIRANAQAIITFNEKDFLNSVLSQYGIEAKHPDEFLMDLFDLNSSTVLHTVKKTRSRLKNPPFSASDYIDMLEQQQLPQFAKTMRTFLGLI